MICLICRQAKVVGGFTSVQFERGETYLLINNVPARICSYCGEAYLDEAAAVRLLKHADKALKAGILNDAIEYNYLAWDNSDS